MQNDSAKLFPGEMLLKDSNYPMLTYFRKADPSKPLVVFINAVSHLPRIAYATGDLKDEDFPGFWLNELGFSYLVVSYPVEHPIYDTVYPHFTLMDWGSQAGNIINKVVVENELIGNLILLPWASGARVLNHLVNKVNQIPRLTIDLICSLNGTPSLPVIEGLNMHVKPDSLGMANIKDSLGESYFCPCVQEQNEINKREVLPLDVYRKYLVNFPIPIIGIGLNYSPEKDDFVFDPYMMRSDSKMDTLSSFPFISFIVSEPTVLPYSTLNHNLTDYNAWSFMIYSQLLDNKVLPGMSKINSLSESKWSDLFSYIINVPEKLCYRVTGNMFSFVGEVGAKLIAEHILDMTKKIPVVEKELQEHIGS